MKWNDEATKDTKEHKGSRQKKRRKDENYKLQIPNYKLQTKSGSIRVNINQTNGDDSSGGRWLKPRNTD
jgi:hypothetical protein